MVSDRLYQNQRAGETATEQRNAYGESSAATYKGWMERLGTKFVDVTLFPPGKEPVVEQHVDDVSTLPDTVKLAMGRTKSRFAVYPWGGRWCLAEPGHPEATKKLRYYDTEEAAHMVAIHRGGR